METKVPMRPKGVGAFVADPGDITVGGPRIGTRFHVDIADDVLAKFPEYAISQALERLGSEAVYRNEQAIRKAVDSFIWDREWCEPIVKEAIRDAVRSFIHDMLASTELAEAIGYTCPRATPPSEEAERARTD